MLAKIRVDNLRLQIGTARIDFNLLWCCKGNFVPVEVESMVACGTVLKRVYETILLM